MTKIKLKNCIDKTKNETRTALLTLYGALNQGQQKKVVRNDEVKKLLVFYGVIEDCD